VTHTVNVNKLGLYQKNKLQNV